MERYENLCRELEAEAKLLDTKYASKHGMEKQDIELAETLFRALKNKEAYLAMVEKKEMEKDGKRWEDSQSYGHHMGMSEARDAYSMHYPYPPMYPESMRYRDRYIY